MKTAPWKLAVVVFGSMLYWPVTILLMMFALIGNCGWGPGGSSGCYANDHPIRNMIIVGVAMTLLYAYILWRILRRPKRIESPR